MTKSRDYHCKKRKSRKVTLPHSYKVPQVRFSKHKMAREVFADDGKIYYAIPGGVVQPFQIYAQNVSFWGFMVPFKKKHLLIPEFFDPDVIHPGLDRASSSTGTYTIVQPRNKTSNACHDAILESFRTLCPHLLPSDVMHVIAEYLKLLIPCSTLLNEKFFFKNRLQPPNAIIEGNFMLIAAYSQ